MAEENTQVIDQNPDDLLTKGLEGLAEGGEPVVAEEASTEAAPEEGAAGDRAPRAEATADEGKPTVEGEKPKAEGRSASNASPQKPKGKQTAQERIRELAAEAKAAKERVRQLEEAQSRSVRPAEKPQEEKPAEPRVIVPRPVKPQYTIEQLNATKQRAIAEGNTELLDIVNEEIEKWRDYKVESAAWEVKNGQAVREYEQRVLSFRQQALTKYPELKDSESPVFKTFQRVCKTFPELLNRSTGDGEFYAAELAGILIKQQGHDAALGALQEENKKLKAENDKLKGKMSPAKSRGAEQTGAEADADDPDADFSRKLRESMTPAS